MQILMLLAVGTLFVVWIVTGVRLMLLARRTRALPEFLLGLALLLQAGVGYPLSVVGQSAGAFAIVAIALGAVCNNTGMGLMAVFTARVFHDTARWAWALVGAMGALLAIQAVGYAVAQAGASSAEEKLQVTLFWGAVPSAASPGPGRPSRRCASTPCCAGGWRSASPTPWSPTACCSGA
jgi:hypothetical protein